MRVIWASRLYRSGSLAGADTASDVGQRLGAGDLLPVDFGAVNYGQSCCGLMLVEERNRSGLGAWNIS